MREQRGWLARSFSLVLILASPTKARTRPRACVGRLPIKSGHIVSAGFPVQHSGCAVYVFFLILFLFLLLSTRVCVCVCVCCRCFFAAVFCQFFFFVFSGVRRSRRRRQGSRCINGSAPAVSHFSLRWTLARIASYAAYT